MGKKYFGRTLKQKLSFMTLVSVLVPLLFLGLFSYKIASNLTEEKAIMSGMNTLWQLNAYLEFIIQDVENMSVFLIGNDEVQSYLQNREAGLLEKGSMSGFLTNLAFSKDYIANITIKPLNGGAAISDTTFMKSGSADIFERIPEYDKESKAWSSLYEDMTPMGHQRMITLYRPIRSISRYKNTGQLAISLDQKFISNHLHKTGLEGNGFVLLLDNENRIIAGSSDKWLHKNIDEYLPNIGDMKEQSGFLKSDTRDEQKTILFSTVSSVNWKLVGVIPVKEYSAQNRYFLILTTMAVGFAMLLGLGLVLFLTHKVIGPLTELTRALRKSNPDEQISILPVRANDEVGQLIMSYNKLNNRIRNLMEHVKLNESLKKEMDLLALQAQINPHFLYNTLSSVQWMALMNKDTKTAEMVGSLSDFLRFSLNKGEEFCAVSQEISHVDNYVTIQKIRYPDKFDFKISVPPELLTKEMLKLLLQPLIENAMLHGILKKQGKGKIIVLAESNGKQMKFTVLDNGIGMSEAKVKKLQEEVTFEQDSKKQAVVKKGSYGLRNVHKRLVLHYGDPAGLHITSKEGEGTKVSFTVPFLEE
ncbi:two-component system sensor histidine kinase YesM [Peribacillus deserti]|uniref:Two-component system sensor histidine kinase YesM n=1 Tax=Peribacillus deserti TaxID=673318 RepID=A0ABS2QF25_9BACI|nr:sensor histidine kinase [Peribacillus deserti]MBM7691738.1 two-component system sensor histidine kinase YesM [Peribacillus deserti]